MIVVVASFQSQPGKEAELENALKALVPPTRSEEGTLTYILHRALHDPGKFLVYEQYRDAEALAQHSAGPVLLDLLGKLGSLAAGDPVIEMYELLSAKEEIASS